VFSATEDHTVAGIWRRGFAALRKFRARGTLLPVATSYQRYHKDEVPAERKWRLEKIGFVWDWRVDLWEQNFAALLKFKRREGHCCVPTFYRDGDLKLGWWVATQRRNWKEMLAERRARLNKIGFVWNAPLRGRAATALKVEQKLRQLRHIDRNPPRLVAREQLRR
jgi:hypothetical protein